MNFLRNIFVKIKLENNKSIILKKVIRNLGVIIHYEPLYIAGFFPNSTTSSQVQSNMNLKKKEFQIKK